MSKTYNVSISNGKKQSGSQRSSWTDMKNARHSAIPRRGTEKKKASKSSRNIVFGFLIIVTCLFAGGIMLKKYAASCEGESCNPIIRPIVNTIDPKLKQDNGLTNILLVGIDTRESNQGLMNTDSLIIATVDHNNQTVSLTSIPRDLWVRYKLPNGNYASSKVNSAYASGEWHGEGKGMDTLVPLVEEIIGEPIHYWVKVTLKGFVEIVDTIGGIDIEVPEYYKDAYPASELPPDMEKDCVPFYHDGKYCIFIFEQGTHHLDGQHALIYARMRLLSPTGDFDRARRQQRVINATKEKVLSTDTLLDPGKLWDMFNIVKENIETSNFTINDIRAALALKDKFDLDNIANIVLDPMLGNVLGKYIYVGDSSSGRGYHILPRDETFEEIHKLLDAIRKYPGIYNEAPVISLYNATGNSKLDPDWGMKLNDENPIIQIRNTNKVVKNPDGTYTGIKIYRFAPEQKTETEKFLKEFFGVDGIIDDINDDTTATAGEDYVIVIGTNSSDPMTPEQ